MAVAVLVIATSVTRAALVKRIEYHGKTPFTRKQMDDMLGFNDKRGLSPEALQHGINRLLGELVQSGCFLAELKLEYLPDSSAVDVEIVNGLVPIAGTVGIAGNSFLSESFLLNILTVRSDKPLSDSRIITDTRNLSLAYADNGYPHAKISVGDFSLSGNKLDFIYKIEEGPRVMVGKILFVGNVQTKPNTILRFSRLASGIPFNRKKVELGRERLVKCGLFKAVSDPSLIAGQNPGTEDLVITVAENPYNNIFGALGYNRDEVMQTGWITGSIDLAFSNLGGRGYQAKINWQRLRRENSRLSAELSIPWLFALDMGITAAVSHRIEDSTYTQSTGRLLAEFPAGEHFRAGVGGEAVRVVPGSTLAMDRSTRYSSLWTIEADYRNGELNPKGFISRLEVEYGRKRYYEPSVQLTVSRIKYDASLVKALSSNQSLFLAFHGRTVISSEKPVPRSDQYAMGGAGSLRGYWEEQFLADQLAWANLEYRYSPDRRLELFPFCDMGYYYDPVRIQRGYRPGYGAGLRMDTALGWISLVYGLGKGDGFSEGKVHISLDSDF